MATLSSHLHRWHRSFMSYCHLAAVTGSADAAALLYDICRRLPLVGGFDHDGHHWVWLSAREAGEVINRARNTAAKYLEQLVRLGFLVREKLGEAQQFGRNRCWYYRPGPECPDFLLGKPVRTRGASSCSNSERSTKTTSKPTNKNRGASAQNKTAHPDDQGHALAPGHEATQQLIKRNEAIQPSPPKGGFAALRAAIGLPCPAETHATRPAARGFA